MNFPFPQFSNLIRRVPLHELPTGHRRWTGNDDNQRNHNGRIPAGEPTVFLELRWKNSKEAMEKLVGGFEIHVDVLEREGYLAPDPAGGIRLKFIHGEAGIVYLGRGITKKKIAVGRA